MATEDVIQALVASPREALSIEVKRWFDPNTPEGKAKIIKATIAMRNHGGGFLVIGFDNETLQESLQDMPNNVRQQFHQDTIQRIVVEYASEPFEVEVFFPLRDGHEFPVVQIQGGVKTPVAVKKELRDSATNTLHVPKNRVYVRSLTANNTPSTTEATWQDWGLLMETCFDNREADIGRFVRRHLTAISSPQIQEIMQAFSASAVPLITSNTKLLQLLDYGRERFNTMARERHYVYSNGTWEVALVIDGDVPPHSANRSFLNIIDSSNPSYTGWPVWVDSRGFADSRSHPYVYEGAWEAFIEGDVDFWRIDPSGQFYLLRGLEDDVTGAKGYPRAPEPGTVLDPNLPIWRTAEAIAVGLEFVKAMGCELEQTQLAYAFRWSRLKGRKLDVWADRRGYISSHRVSAYEDEIVSSITVPLDTPKSALSQYVQRVTQPLFEAFNGFEMSIDVIEDIIKRLLERRH